MPDDKRDPFPAKKTSEMKRFYKDVDGGRDAGWFSLPAGRQTGADAGAAAALLLPTRALAEAIAEEWRAQGEEMRPVAMPLTRLANTVLDGVRANARGDDRCHPAFRRK